MAPPATFPPSPPYASDDDVGGTHCGETVANIPLKDSILPYQNHRQDDSSIDAKLFVDALKAKTLYRDVDELRIDKNPSNTPSIDADRLEPIAIIGLSCRFPGDASSPEAFWKLLVEGRSAMTDVPSDRYNLESFYDSSNNQPGMTNVRGGHFLKDDIATFDAPFFSMSPNEAQSMDPQQRWLLETAYEALENAGLPMDSCVGSDTSVHVGSFLHDYESMMGKDPEQTNVYKATGTGLSMLANRVSWFYDFKGPSIQLDTACSASLTALHLACQSLRSRESRMGIVAGCNLLLNPETTASLTDLNFLSPDGRCYSFDHRANGYSRGEGFGVVIIKPLHEALADGNTIRAVIRATGINQDGRTPGITQPSTAAQESMIRRTYTDGGINMSQTRYFEAHGTGTALGDPIEAKAIYKAFQDCDTSASPIYVGAVKSNIGHLEGASGVAGLIKTIMVLENGTIPPNFDFEKPNAMIQPEAWNLAFPSRNTDWPHTDLRRASVSSFGFGGANAHAVLDDALHYLESRGLSGKHRTKDLAKSTPQDREPEADVSQLPPPNPKLLVWSGFDEAALESTLAAVRHFHKCQSATKEGTYLRDLAHTLFAHRSRLAMKSFSIVNSKTDLPDVSISRPVRSSKSPKLAFIFTGQGAQWQGMGQQLMAYASFRQSIDAAEIYFQELGAQWLLTEELFRMGESSKLDLPAYSQPICTALQVALVDLLDYCGVKAAAVVGHSSGEIAAAYCYGGLSRECAWKVAYFRGVAATAIASTKKAPSTMMSVNLPLEKAQPYLDEVNEHSEGPAKVSIGCINSPNNTTLSGTEVPIDELHDTFEHDGVVSRKLKVMMAYHSEVMHDGEYVYREMIRNLKSRNLEDGVVIPTMYSSLTGEQVKLCDLASSEYWVQNMVSPVRFCDAVEHICQKPTNQISKIGQPKTNVGISVHHVLEVGPHCALQGPLRDTFEKAGRSADIGYSSMLRRGQAALHTTLEALGTLHCHGFDVNVTHVNTDSPPAKSPTMLTDLPSYPFNHTKQYWLESRKSKAYRFRKFPHHELLGTRDPDSHALDAKWNNRITTSEHDFVQDHQVNGVEAYPATGMLVMAIEAVRQLVVSDEREVCGYRLRDVSLSKALIVPSGPEGVEIQLTMRPTTTASNNIWHDFRLYSYHNGEWSEVCSGSISVEYEPASHENIETQHEMNKYRTIYHEGADRCKLALSSKRLYDETFAEHGLQYGPSFQSARSIYYNGNGGEATALLNLREWATKVQHNKIRKHLIHPAALDCVFQLSFPAVTSGGKEKIPTMVPTKVSKLWLSQSLFDVPKDQSVKIHATGEFVGFRNAKTSIVVLDANDDPCIAVEGEMTFVAGNESLNSTNQQERHQRFYNVDWKPDAGLLGNSAIADLCTTSQRPTPLDQMMADDKEALCLITMKKLADDISLQSLVDTPHLRRYYEWMQHRLETHASLLETYSMTYGLNDGNLAEVHQRLRHKIQAQDIEGQALARVAQNLKDFLTGEADALQLLFGDDLLDDYYRDAHDTPYVMNRAKAFVEVMAHKKPGLKVLEIGAGTGSATGYILEALGHHAADHGSVAPRFGEYHYTDLSPSFFEKAKEHFSSDRIICKTLNIENDPVEQGFEAGGYDLVVAANVLHATADLDVTLGNVRKLMSPGGKMILFEGVNPERLRISFIFGLLPGWWLSTEEHRQWSPMMKREDWQESLLRNDFNGIDAVLSNFDDPQHQLCSAMICSAAEHKDQLPHESPTILIIRDPSSSYQSKLGETLRANLSETARTCSVLSLDQVRDNPHIGAARCLMLYEVEGPWCLPDIDEATFSDVKLLLGQAHGLFWLTHNEPGSHANPKSGATVGLARALAMEREGFRFVTLAMQSTDADIVSSCVQQVFGAALSSQSSEFEPEYAERKGRLCISRVSQAAAVTNHVSTKTKPKIIEKRSLSQVSSPMKMTIGSVGLLDSLRFIGDDQNVVALSDGEIEIDTKAVGLNFRDILIALGQLPSAYFGNECAGIVTNVGSIASSRFKVGDRVVCPPRGAFRTRNRCDASAASLIPDHMDFSSAATLPIAYCTAVYCVDHWARLQPKETILIHSASGGFGQAAVQLAQLRGAEIYATVGTDEKRQLVKDLYSIPDDHIFSSRSTTFAQGILRMTNGLGVDVVLNSLSGEALRASWECIAPLGRFIEVGKKDIYTTGSALPMAPLAKNVMFASVDLAMIIHEQPRLLASLMQSVMDLAQDKQITAPAPVKTYPATGIEDAFRHMQSGKHTGKIVIEFGDDDVVPIVPASLCVNTDLFDNDATYLIAGGLGGLGRSISRWMVHRGAKNLVLLSRSTNYAEEVLVFLKELRDQGVTVATPPCDVSNADRLREILEECSQYMPPIKGCIQGSMVLENAMFTNMSHDTFNVPLQAKITGSWNLHSLLPNDLSFFILLSSYAGIIGSVGQSNYAAGNTYQDSLARHRVCNGQKAVALDLGVIESVGIVSEHPDVAGFLQSTGHEGLAEDELHALLEYHCDPNLPLHDPKDAQVIASLELPSTLHSKNLVDLPWMSQPLFRQLWQIRASSSSSTSDNNSPSDLTSQTSFETSLAAQTSTTDAASFITDILQQKISRMLGLEVDAIDTSKPLHAFGVDSLVAIELRNWFQKALGADVAVFEILGNGGMEAVARQAAERSRFVQVKG